MATVCWRIIQWFRLDWRIGNRRGDYPRRTASTNNKVWIWKGIKWIEIKISFGVESITAELLQAVDEETKHTLYCLINNIYTTGKIPDDFNKCLMAMLPMKNKSTNSEEYRALSIVTHTSNILTKIILGWIQKKIDVKLAGDQFGFWKIRDTREDFFFAKHCRQIL